VLELLLELVELGHGQMARQLQQLAAQVQQLQQAQQQGGGAVGPWPGGHSCGGGTAAAASDAADGSGACGAAAGGAAQRAKRQHRPLRAWRCAGKSVGAVMVGRVSRVAAAGTLAVAGLLGGNHPALRLARVCPLLYLLRSGL
jgi:hypothetical protein